MLWTKKVTLKPPGSCQLFDTRPRSQPSVCMPIRLTTSFLAEQEAFIASLAERNSQRNLQYRRLLLLVPLIASIPYLIALPRLPTPLLSTLALTSLASTAYLLHRLPPGSTGIAVLDKLGPTTPPPGWIVPSPLEMWLPYLNLGMGAVLVAAGLLAGAKGQGDDPWAGVLGLGNLPALVYVVVLAAKMVMASVDPERELNSLKYQFKGA